MIWKNRDYAYHRINHPVFGRGLVVRWFDHSPVVVVQFNDGQERRIWLADPPARKAKRPPPGRFYEHKRFGLGRALSARDTDSGLAVTVRFLDYGERVVLSGYLTPRPDLTESDWLRELRRRGIPDDRRARISGRAALSWINPEVRALRCRRLKEAWADPQARERRRASQKAGWARRRAENAKAA